MRFNPLKRLTIQRITLVRRHHCLFVLSEKGGKKRAIIQIDAICFALNDREMFHFCFDWPEVMHRAAAMDTTLFTISIFFYLIGIEKDCWAQ